MLKRLMVYSLFVFSFATCISRTLVNISLEIFCATFLVFMWHRENRSLPTFNVESKSLFKVMAFFAAALFSTALCSFSIYLSLQVWWRLYIVRMLPFFLVFFVARFTNKNELKKITLCINLSLTIASLYALWQFYHGDMRPSGFLGHYMNLGSFYACLMPFSLFTVIEPQMSSSSAMWKINVASYSISFAGMLANNTRGAWIAIAITSILILLCYSWMKRNVRYGIFLLALVLVSAGIIGTNKMFMQRLESIPSTTIHSNHERLLLWQSSINMAKDYPLVGIGLGEFAAQYKTKYILPQAQEPNLEHAHNMFFHLLAEGGIIGLLAYIVLFGKLIIGEFKDYLRTHHYTYLLTAAVALSVLIHGCTEFNAIVYKIFWLIIGWCYMMRTMENVVLVGGETLSNKIRN